MATLAANTYNLKIAFTTWVCPEWTVPAILDGMQTYKFDGVELRLGKGHLHGVELDASAEYLADVRKQFDEYNAAVACLATSLEFGNPDIVERKKNVEALKRALNVAELLGAPYIRVFGGEVPKNLELTGMVDYVSEALAEAAEYAEAEKSRAVILVESEGPFSYAGNILEVMRQVFSPKIGVLWDVLQTIRVMEGPEETFDKLGAHVRHIHINDADYNDDRTRLEPCEPGEGVIPFTRVVDLLKAGLFRGYLCIDPLKRDADPDELLPKYAEYLNTAIGARTGS